MKQVFSSPDSVEVGLFASRLQSAGIACEIRNETQVIPGMPFQPELWVLNDSDYEDAARLIGGWRSPAENPDVPIEIEPPEELAVLDLFMAGLYNSISGLAGERDWERFRLLFFPGARLLRTIVSPEGEVSLSAMDVEGFINFAAPFLREHDFEERELARREDQFGQIAQVFSTYVSTTSSEGEKTTKHGINSVQLWFDGRRWWVLNMVWDDERPGNPIPPEYLP